MKRSILYPTLLCAMLILISGCVNTSQSAKIAIIPQPSQIDMGKGEYRIKSNLTILCTDSTLMSAAEYLKESLSGVSTCRIISEGKADIVFVIDSTMKNNGYILDIEMNTIRMKACGVQGIISAIATLRQLLPADINMQKEGGSRKLYIPVLRVEDAPRFSWRGLHLDASRHFWNKEEIFKMLDLMAQYKLNKFHWHLTDDQGWRIEIKAYPLLTQKGAWRKLNNHDKGCERLSVKRENPDLKLPAEKIKVIDGDTLYGGFYTQDDIREVVAYATKRGIDVLPEIDIPGHSLIAIEQYPILSCNGEGKMGDTFWYPVCAGKQTTLEFFKTVYEEVFSLFPYEYVHMGADEVTKEKWKKCPDCQRRMKDKGLRTEEELQSWFVHEMEAFFNLKGKRLIGWDEIQEGGLSKTATVMWWRSWAPRTIALATAQGNQVIACPTNWFYFDYDQKPNSVSDLYNYDPVIDSLPQAQKDLIIGVQGNLWTEWIPTMRRAEFMYFPRFFALSEIAWVVPEKKDEVDFNERMNAHFARLDAMGVNYCIPFVTNMPELNIFIDSTVIDIKRELPSIAIRYTEDGTTPNANSTLYTGAITIKDDKKFKFRQFRPDGSPGDVFSYTFSKAAFSKATEVEGGVSPGLDAVWHEFRGDSCHKIDKSRIISTFKTNNVSIPNGVKGNIGLILRGYIDIPEEDIYTFYLSSDDGSTLFIDSQMVIDNDGMHSTQAKSSQMALCKGLHPIEVRYFDPNGGSLQFGTMDKSGKKTELGSQWFKHKQK